MDTDPIRARLDNIDNINVTLPDFPMTMGGNYRQMRLALCAVLDLCVGAASFALADNIRRVIAEHLGVTDEGS